MKTIFWMTLPALTFLLAACGSPLASDAAPTPLEAIPAPIETAPPDGVIASAEAQPARESRISFTLSAPVKEVFVKEGDVVTAGQLLMTLYAPDLEGQVTQAELAEKAGELEFSYWIPHRYDRPPEREWQAKAEWEQKKMALEVAKAVFAQSSIYAPYDAVVVEVHVKAGEFAQAGKAVVTLADTAHMQIVTTDLSERDAPRAQPGQRASIYIEALNQTVSGTVLRVSPISKTVGGDVVFPVTLELDQQTPGLLWGMSAEVEIQTK